jgi:hypothetical protein
LRPAALFRNPSISSVSFSAARVPARSGTQKSSSSTIGANCATGSPREASVSPAARRVQLRFVRCSRQLETGVARGDERVVPTRTQESRGGMRCRRSLGATESTAVHTRSRMYRRFRTSGRLPPALALSTIRRRRWPGSASSARLVVTERVRRRMADRWDRPPHAGSAIGLGRGRTVGGLLTLEAVRELPSRGDAELCVCP